MPPSRRQARPRKLPIDVIERILRYTFPLRRLVSSSKEISPPRGSTALLRVSRSVRAYCLPLFYRSVTIAKPSDWVAFFGRGKGIFVTGGYSGTERWRMVDELAIYVGARIPCPKEGILAKVGDRVLVELDIPICARQLSRLVILDQVPEDLSEDDYGDAGTDNTGVADFGLRTAASPHGLPDVKRVQKVRWERAGKSWDLISTIREEVMADLDDIILEERGTHMFHMIKQMYPDKINTSFNSWKALHISWPGRYHTIDPPAHWETELPPAIHINWVHEHTFWSMITGKDEDTIGTLLEVHRLLPGAVGSLNNFPRGVLAELSRVLDEGEDDPDEEDDREPHGSWNWTEPGSGKSVEHYIP